MHVRADAGAVFLDYAAADADVADQAVRAGLALAALAPAARVRIIDALPRADRRVEPDIFRLRFVSFRPRDGGS